MALKLLKIFETDVYQSFFTSDKMKVNNLKYHLKIKRRFQQDSRQTGLMSEPQGLGTVKRTGYSDQARSFLTA